MAPSGTDARAPIGPIDPDDHWGQQLGIEMLEVTPERVVARIVIDGRHHQPSGSAHGGV